MAPAEFGIGQLIEIVKPGKTRSFELPIREQNGNKAPYKSAVRIVCSPDDLESRILISTAKGTQRFKIGGLFLGLKFEVEEEVEHQVKKGETVNGEVYFEGKERDFWFRHY